MAALDLGRAVDSGATVALEAADLTTHALCVGMTGGGKTGLCVVLLEELGRAGVPVVAVDTKGDLTNLALLFDDLAPSAFAPWMAPGGESAEQVAARWREGLAASGLTAADVAALRRGSPRRLVTPGSDAGCPVNILSGLNPPALDWSRHAADLRARISTTVSALLGLVGVTGEPLTCPEHLLVSCLLEQLWQSGGEVSLEALIAGVQAPPFAKIGVFEVDAVMPPKERLKLALLLNNLLASPTFQAWQTGVPLSPELFLPGPDGRAPTTILYLAHLQEHERHFFLTLFLEMVNTWMRQQTGTRDLRLLIFCDEVLGYLPPHPANPPTKGPLLTLFKQARAFGVGLCLATQNPVDIDYKALTNAGTWLVGRLQTEQDRDRLGETLEAAVQGSGRADVAATIAGLERRQFLATAPSLRPPAVMASRWAMGYLAGPLTLPQIVHLRELGLIETPDASAAPEPVPAPAPAVSRPVPAAAGSPPLERPAPAGEVPVYYLDGAELTPFVFCRATVHYVRQEPPVDHLETLALQCEWPPAPGGAPRVFVLAEAALRPGSPTGAELPAWSADPRALDQAGQVIVDRLYAKRRLALLANVKLGLRAEAGESRQAFDARCRAALARRFEELQDKLEAQYAERLETLRRKLLEEQRQLEQAEDAARSRAQSELFDVGSQVMGALLGGGRRRKVTSALRGAARVTRAGRSGADRVEDQREDVMAVEAEIGALAEHQEADEAELAERLQALLEATAAVELAPRRQDIALLELGIVWAPRSDVG